MLSLQLIMENYRQNIPAGKRVKSTTPNRRVQGEEEPASDDGIESGGEPAFETQNYLYELQSRCNNLEYEKTKSAMLHDNFISELKYKNGYLEQLSSTLSQQNQSLSQERDVLRTLLAEVREQNFSFSKEIGHLRMQMNSLMSHSSTQLDHPSLLQGLREEVASKDELIKSLQQQLVKSSPSSKEQSLAEELGKENMRLQEEMEKMQQSLRDSRNELQEFKLGDQRHKKQICQLQEELRVFREQNEAARKKSGSLVSEEKKKWSDLVLIKQEQLKSIENERLSLDSKVNELTLEVGRLKCQKANLQQLNQYLQTQGEENQTKRKHLQEEVFRVESEMSELRSQLFNQKLEHKKQMNSLKLEFEEERIRLIETAEETSKDANRLREQYNSSSRQALDIEELSMRTQGIMTDLERANNKIAHLTSQNETLISQLKNNEYLLQQKQEKLDALEDKIKSEHQKRVALLEDQVCSLQRTNSELELKVELLQRKTGLVEEKTETSRDLVEMMKLNLKESDQHVRQLEQQVRELQQTTRNKQEEIIRLEGDLRLTREIRAAGSGEDKVSTIELLNQEIASLNKEVQQERQKHDREKNQALQREEKLKENLRETRNENQNSLRENERLRAELGKLEKQISIRGKQREQLREEVRGLVMQREKAIWEVAMKQNMKQEGRVQNKTTSNQPENRQQDQSQLYERLVELQKENLTLKVDYSTSLEEINHLLVRYQTLEKEYNRVKDQYKRVKDQNNRVKDQYNRVKDEHSKENSSLKNSSHKSKLRITQLEQECERLRNVVSELEGEQQYYLNLINQAKKEKASFSFGSGPVKDTRRISEQLWLDKDCWAVEGSHRPYCRHKI